MARRQCSQAGGDEGESEGELEGSAPSEEAPEGCSDGDNHHAQTLTNGRAFKLGKLAKKCAYARTVSKRGTSEQLFCSGVISV